MPQIVIDASVTLDWLFETGPAQRQADSIFEHSQLVAPQLWQLEVLNAILVKERRKLLVPSDAAYMIDLLSTLNVDIIDEPAMRNLGELLALARPHQLTSYDAVYLELAMSAGLSLYTRDKNLQAAARRVGVKLVSATR